MILSDEAVEVHGVEQELVLKHIIFLTEGSTATMASPFNDCRASAPQLCIPLLLQLWT